MSQMRIFLSHSSQDKSFADVLVKALREAGADVWYDEDNLRTGELHDEILRELLDRCVFLVVLSSGALESEWVRDECLWAYKRYKQDRSRIILPVANTRLDPEDFSSLFFLEDFRRVERVQNQSELGDGDIIARVLHLLELPLSRELSETARHLPSDIAVDLQTRGKARAIQDELDKAAELFDQTTLILPTEADAWANYAQILTKLGKNEQALYACKRALTLNPDQAWAWGIKAVVLGALGRVEDALAAQERSLAVNTGELGPPPILNRKPSATSQTINPSLPRNENKREIVAGSRQASQMPIAEDLTKAETLPPAGKPPLVPSPSPTSSSPVAQDIKERNQGSVSPVEDALAINSTDEGNWVHTGEVLYAMGLLKEAIDAFNQALELDPKNALAWNNKGVMLSKLGRHEEALVALDRVLALYPNYADAWSNRGRALTGLSRFEEALASYNRSLELDHRSPIKWSGKGEALLRLKRYSEALTAYEQAITLDPLASYRWKRKAVALRALGRVAEAKEALDRAQMLEI